VSGAGSIVSDVVAGSGPVADVVSGAATAVGNVATEVTGPVADVVSGAGSIVGDVVAGSGPVADVVPAADVPVLPGAPAVPEVSDAGPATPSVQEIPHASPLIGLVPDVPEAHGPVVAAGGDAGSILLPDAVPDVSPVAGVDQPLDDGGSFVDPLLQGVPPQYVIAMLSVLTMTRVAVYARCGGLANARVVFSNVRLIPCLVGSGVERATSGFMNAVTDQASGAVSAARSVAADRASRSGGAVEAAPFVQQSGDGFRRAVERHDGNSEDGIGDTRLMIQLGFLVGFIYVAFLATWFWATRLRWGPGSKGV